MIDFLNFISPYIYILLVVSSVLFGISLAIRFWVYNTIKNIKKETGKNFNLHLSETEQQQVFLAINTAKIDLYKVVVNNAKSKKKRRKKDLKTVVLEEQETNKISDVVKNLIKDVYKPFSIVNGNERGYLSFTKNEIFKVLKTVLHRLDEILSNSGINWVKNIKLTYLATGINLYVDYKNFAEKIWVKFIFKAIKFSNWFLRVVSPVSIGKYFIKNLLVQNLSLLICETIVEAVAKELAVIYKTERAGANVEDLSNQKAIS